MQKRKAVSLKEKANTLAPMLLLTPWGSAAHACPCRAWPRGAPRPTRVPAGRVTVRAPWSSLCARPISERPEVHMDTAATTKGGHVQTQQECRVTRQSWFKTSCFRFKHSSPQRHLTQKAAHIIPGRARKLVVKRQTPTAWSSAQAQTYWPHTNATRSGKGGNPSLN